MPTSTFFYPYNFLIFNTTVQLLEKFLDTVPKDKAILLWSLEIVSKDSLAQYVKLIDLLGIKHKTFWWLQPSHGYDSELLKCLGDNLYQIDIDLLYLDLHMNVCETSTPNKVWNPCTRNFLFPTGKPNRPNRIRLLHKFYQCNMLNNCNWSLFINSNTYKSSQSYLPELTNEEYENFVVQHIRSIDNIKLIDTGVDNNHTNGYPFDGSAYSTASFKIISETQMFDKPIVSEKTWITVANQLPFIVIGYQKNLEYLKKIGFRTFEKYLPISNYDDIEDQEQRLDAVVENTKFWISHIHTQEKQIVEDIKYNHALLLNNIAISIKQANQLAMDLHEPSRDYYNLVPLSIEQHNWVLFYYNVKDLTWPDCFLEEQFAQLPLHIQDECIDVFGYQPT